MDGTLFTVQTKCLHLVGLYRANLIKRPKLLIALYVLIYMIMVTCVIAEGYFIVRNHKDILSSSEAFSPLSTIIITMIKLSTFFIWRENFYELTDEIKQLAADARGSGYSQLMKVNQIDKNVTLVYLASSLFVGIVQNSATAVSDLINVMRGDPVEREMPWKSDFTVFGYDPKNSPGYEVSYLDLVAVTYFTILIFVPIDCLFFGSCLNICAHFDILRESFDGDKKKFIKKHQQLLSLIEKLKKLYEPIILGQFLITSMLLCVLGFQLVMFRTFLKRIVVAFFGLAMVIQLFVYTYGGQLVMDKSVSVAEELYQTDKDFIIIIARSHKASIIKSGFYEASSATLSSILSSAASLITLLKSFID